jgi:hypothetical protein
LETAGNHTHAELPKSENRPSRDIQPRLAFNPGSTVMSCLTLQQEKHKSQNFVAYRMDVPTAFSPQSKLVLDAKTLTCRVSAQKETDTALCISMSNRFMGR